MTPERLAEIEALVAAATPGPWSDCGDGDILGDNDEIIVGTTIFLRNPSESDREYRLKDAGFIAAARTAVPELLAEVRRLEAELAEQERVLLQERAGLLAHRDAQQRAEARVAELEALWAEHEFCAPDDYDDKQGPCPWCTGEMEHADCGCLGYEGERALCPVKEAADNHRARVAQGVRP